jgi:hypothetical protein
MSHDAGQFFFWRPVTQPLANPAALANALHAGQAPPELHDLDLPAILAAIKKAYRSFNPDDPFIDIPRQQTAITFGWSTKHISAFFEGDAFRQMDKVSLLMSSLGLACYDILSSQSHTVDALPRFLADPLMDAFNRILVRIKDDFYNNFFASLGRTPVSLTTFDRQTKKLTANTLTRNCGNAFVALLKSAKTKGTWAALPKSPTCELGVEDITGTFAWPAYTKRGKANRA